MENIVLEAIDVNDRRFCISYPLSDQELFLSMSRVGIVQPIIVTGPPPFVVVTGYKRIEAARQLGWTTIPCLIEETGEKEALLCAIHDNIGRALNIVEKSYAVERMVRFGFSQEETLETMTLLSLPSNDKLLRLLVTIACADDKLKDFVVTRKVSLRNIEALFKFDALERIGIVSLLSPLHTTESLVREVLQLMSLVKLRRGIMELDDLHGVKDMDEVKKRLKHMTHPKLSALEAELADLKGKCALPPGIDIKVDPFFEKEYIDISIRARKPEDLKRAIDKLSGILEASYVRSILGLAKG
jgi:hypothetical protein